MPRTPEISQPEGQPSEPDLIRFISLKPDEKLLIVRVESPQSSTSMVRLTKLKTPQATEDVEMSDNRTVTKEEIGDAILYLKGVNPYEISETEVGRFYKIAKELLRIQDKLR